jgi:tetratricopeptide (TPR) repeat protein
VGLIDAVIPLVEKSVRLSPRDPNIGQWYLLIGRVHLLQSRIDAAISWLQKARSADPGAASPHVWLAAAYGLKGESGRAAAELSEARKLAGDGSYSSIAELKAPAHIGSRDHLAASTLRPLYETTYFAGLRKAGVSEE